MYKILVNAYACSPHTGSEPGMAWNWCVHLARHCELHIITEGEFKEHIEAALLQLPEAKNMHFYYNPVSDRVRKMCWNQGDWRFYRHYKKWQYSTYLMALELIGQKQIDIVHQLNMIGFREPGYLWKIKTVPFVWGPVDAKMAFPTAYLAQADLKTRSLLILKNFITKLQLQYSKRVHQAVGKASVVVAASSNSKQNFSDYLGTEAFLLNETGCRVNDIPFQEKPDKTTLDLLWVGKMDFRKQLNLAIQSLAKVQSQNIKLHIVGGGDAGPYQKLAVQLGVENYCIWHGMLPHDEVQAMMQDCDLLFFTSVAEGTPHVVLEALANSLPVLCFDTCGHGDSVNDKVGVKIPLTYPSDSIEKFAEKITLLLKNPQVLAQLSRNCGVRQKELSWDNKAQQMLGLYKRVVTEKAK
ncbi:glycosyltransferase family 4 protein [Pseudozobellia thermophila]|uniref:Glycosyltransferase involved in cell wall bisynthesis n=1 Tax=Pseudozobellia thermophila TaxID=192903 RepID=A0A1M6KRJ4_9FLAO|nr:glycosyltransferase family 4 protein [Pseudozobellia thermophila]SHJ61514.1 Glycosyltransferase involved in cell wall bisynthesis [Pseudozobellia thermophila]